MIKSFLKKLLKNPSRESRNRVDRFVKVIVQPYTHVTFDFGKRHIDFRVNDFYPRGWIVKADIDPDNQFHGKGSYCSYKTLTPVDSREFIRALLDALSKAAVRDDEPISATMSAEPVHEDRWAIKVAFHFGITKQNIEMILMTNEHRPEECDCGQADAELKMINEGTWE